MFSTKMFFLDRGEGKISSGNKPLGQENQPASQLMLTLHPSRYEASNHSKYCGLLWNRASLVASY